MKYTLNKYILFSVDLIETIFYKNKLNVRNICGYVTKGFL